MVPFPMQGWDLREPALRAGISEICEALNINCIVDVGANQGQYGEFLREIGYSGRIVSFEPVEKTYSLLSARANKDSKWKTHRLAVGAKEEMLEISVMSGDQFSSLLPMNSYGRTQYTTQAVVNHCEQVKVVRLDSIMEEITEGIEEPRVYLKMDTQGYDLRVLEGASGCLSQIFGLQSEISLRPIYEGMPSYLTSLAQMNALGFTITSLVPVSRDEHLRVIEFDCLMIRDN